MSRRIGPRRFSGISSLCALGLGVLSFEHQAAAQEGFALNRFDPSERGSVFFRGDPLDIAGNGRWAAGVVGDFGHKVLVARDGDGGEIATPIKDQLFLHLGASVVLFERLRLGLSAPVLAYQRASDFDAPGISLSPSEDFSLGDVRLGADVLLLGKIDDAFRLAGGVRFYLPTGNRDAFASDGSLRLAPSASVAGDIGLFVYGVAAGVMVRTEGQDFYDEPVGSEAFLSLFAGLRLFERRLVVGPELFASTNIADGSDGFMKKASTPVELILGGHYEVVRDVRLGFGFGPGLTEGLGAPATRWLASVEWVPGVEEEPAPSDRDGDGIIDPQDRCPDVVGVAQSNPELYGCPAEEKPEDSDGDGITDDLDACPTQAGPATPEDPKKNGCPPPPDQDGDGVSDDVDACPAQAGVPTPDDPARHGCPEPADTDGDGITDDKDACPRESGAANADPSKNGCPLAIVQESSIRILERIEFETNKAALTSESDRVLEAVAKVLEQHPEITKITIEGHTDAKGPAWLNRDLSRKRAAAVVDWLVKRGIKAERLTSAGFGPDKPIATNDSDEGRQKNRRVEFQILESGKGKPAKATGN